MRCHGRALEYPSLPPGDVHVRSPDRALDVHTAGPGQCPARGLCQRPPTLHARRCTPELWRTIKPDIVLHADRNLLRSVLTLDFKFPCPDTNEPRWTHHGENSAYAGSTQDQIYRKALGGEPLLISPRKGVVTP